MTSTNAIGAAEIVEISPGDAVPFTGNLVPLSTFKLMATDISTKDLLEQELERCRRSRDTLDTEGALVPSIALSFVLGLVVGAVAHHYLKVP